MGTADSNNHKVELSSILRRAGKDTVFKLEGGEYSVCSVDSLIDFWGLPYILKYTVRWKRKDGKWSSSTDYMVGYRNVRPEDVEVVARVHPKDIGIVERLAVNVTDWRHSRLIRRG